MKTFQRGIFGISLITCLLTLLLIPSISDAVMQTVIVSPTGIGVHDASANSKVTVTPVEISFDDEQTNSTAPYALNNPSDIVSHAQALQTEALCTVTTTTPCYSDTDGDGIAERITLVDYGDGLNGKTIYVDHPKTGKRTPYYASGNVVVQVGMETNG